MATVVSMQGDQKELTSMLTSRFQSFDSWRQQFDTKAIENYKLFRGYKETLPEGVQRSNLHIPRTYEALDTIRGRLVTSFFRTRPYVFFKPEPHGGDPMTLTINEKKAEVGQALVDAQLEKNGIVSKFYDFITALLIFPCGVMSVGWRYEEEMVSKNVPTPQIVMGPEGPQVAGWHNQKVESIERIWDDNEVQYVDFFDFWPDPRGTDLDTCRGVFHREWITREDLHQKMQFLYELGEGMVFPVDLDKIAGNASGLEEGRSERLSAIGISTETRDMYSQIEEADGEKELFELLHYWEDDRHTLLVNRAEVVYDGPSPYWRHRKKPFITGTYDPLPGEFYGLSAVDLIHDLQHELNTQHNQRIDNVSFVLNRMWAVRRGSEIDESELMSRPAGVIRVDNVDQDIKEIAMSDVTSSSFQEEAITGQNLENVLAVPPVVRGTDSRRTETATEVATKSSNAGVRFDVKIHLFEELGVKRLCLLMDCNNQQFITEERMIALGPEESTQWRLITPGELIGEWDYSPAGTSTDPAANKEMRREQLSQMISWLIQSGNPFVDYYELTKAWMESHDLRNIYKFLLPREAVQAVMQQQLMEAAAIMQGQAEGAGGQGGAPPQMPSPMETGQPGVAPGPGGRGPAGPTGPLAMPDMGQGGG